MKTTALAAAALSLAFCARALADNIFVRDANVSASQMDRRDDLTQLVRDSVQQMPDDYLVSSESRADAILQPTLMGSDGSYSLRIDRIEDSKVVSSTERSVGDWTDISDISRQATLTALADPDSAASQDHFVETTAPDSVPSQAKGTQTAAIGATARAGRSATEDSVSGATAGTADADAQPSGGESHGFNPIQALRTSPGHVTVGLGPGFGMGMNSANAMYSATGGYIWDFTPRFAGKVMGEADLGSGNDNARMLDAYIGADAYIPEIYMGDNAKPYVTANLGIGSARNQASDGATGLTAGFGAGVRIPTNEKTDLDILLHYELLTASVDGANPSVLGIRAAFNF